MGSICFGCRERQGAQPRPLAPDEDDRLHYFVVVVDEGFVVVVVGRRGRGSWSWSTAGRRRRRRLGTVVAVAPGRRRGGDGLVPGQHLQQRRDRRGRRLGQATCWPARSPTVISWRLRSLRLAGLSGGQAARLTCCSPFFRVLVDSTHQRACTSPTLPASGVPAAHFWPFVYAGTLADGYFSVVLVSVRPVYPEANLPNVALLPASLAVLGAIEQDAAPGRRQAGGRAGRGGRRAPAPSSRRCRRPVPRATWCSWSARPRSGSGCSGTWRGRPIRSRSGR